MWCSFLRVPLGTSVVGCRALSYRTVVGRFSEFSFSFSRLARHEQHYYHGEWVDQRVLVRLS
jgi:hypothetical protein